MRAVVQRVSQASVTVEGKIVGACGRGLLVLVGIGHGDTAEEATRLAGKLARLRIFENEEGSLYHSLLDVGGEALVVSQFTLYASTSKGNRPSFTTAAAPAVAEPLVALVATELGALGVPTTTGRFGTRMQVELVNDGPVTIVLDV